MRILLYGFNWKVYAEKIMPAFSRWLIANDEGLLYELYCKSRCAVEEEFLPSVMRHLQTWTRALQAVHKLPRGPHIQQEYQLLCTADTFTAVSDLYVHRHPPQLTPCSDAIRAIWGAVVEHYCQIPLIVSDHTNQSSTLDIDDHPQAIPLGRHPSSLYLRGWLAQHSVRAMALFELLVCHRRALPFGQRAGEPYQSYTGYLTPLEVDQLARCFPDQAIPDPTRAYNDFKQFRQQSLTPDETPFRMIDEILPANASQFATALHTAAELKQGLLCLQL